MAAVASGAAAAVGQFVAVLLMSMLLSSRLLSDLEARLRAEGLAAVQALAPGLTDQQIDTLTAPYGFDLPEEARVWWRWHNGSHADAGKPAQYFLPFRAIFALEDALRDYAEDRELPPEPGAREALLRLVDEKPVIYFRCAGARDAPVPVYGRSDWASPPELRLPSIGELVMTWSDYIDRGDLRHQGRRQLADRPGSAASARRIGARDVLSIATSPLLLSPDPGALIRAARRSSRKERVVRRPSAKPAAERRMGLDSLTTSSCRLTI